MLSLSILLLPLLASLTSAQQNVLVNGNSQLPTCAQSCQPLIQANAACSGTGSVQAAWTCFCQSAYLTTLKTTAVGVCDTACTDATQNAQVQTWYTKNCGSDFGVSEHADDSAAGTTTTTAAAAGAAATTASTAANANAGTTAASSVDGTGTTAFNPTSNNTGGDWWSSHYVRIALPCSLSFPILTGNSNGSSWS